MEEQWKDIEGYDGIYQVSNLGRVRSLDRTYIRKNGMPHTSKGCVMSLYDSKDGYKAIRLRTPEGRKTFRVHRLVAQAFIENPDNLPLINHKDENKKNNIVDNLEWCSNEYNINYGTTIQRLSDKHKNHPNLSKPIEQYSMDGHFINSYPSAAEAERQTGILAVNIASCCKGIYSQSGGYVWKYKE